MEPTPDELDRLAAAVVAGRPEAFRALFDAVYRELRVFVSARTADQELVDETVQAALVTAYEKLSTYRAGSGCLLPWLKGIARNRLLKELAHRRQATTSEGDLLDRLAADEEAEAPEADEQMLSRLQRCLERLSAPARSLVEQRYVQRLGVAVLAETLGRSAASVSVSLCRTRNALRQCIGGEGG